MSPDFKSFLMGLLNKNPKERLTWPELLHHPFIVETREEVVARKQRLISYNVWAGIENEDLVP